MGVKILNSLNEVSFNKHVYTLNKNDIFEKEKNKFSLETTPYLNTTNFTVSAIYSVLNNLFVYDTDGKIYSLTDTGAIEITSRLFSSKPSVLVVKCAGKDEILIAGTNYAYLLNAQKSVEIEYGEQYLFHNGRLISAKNNELFISKTYPFDRDEEMTFTGEKICFKLEEGKILGLSSQEKEIIIFTEKAIYSLKTVGEIHEFSLNKIKTPYLNVSSGSVKEIGSDIYFISEYALFSYKNGKVEKVIDIPEKLPYKSFYSLFNYYALGYGTGHDLKAVNVLTKEVITLEPFKDITRDNKYALLANRIFRINKTLFSEKHDGFNGVMFLDFDSAKLKAITQIEVEALYQTTIKIKGDFGEREYRVSKGLGIIKCNLPSKEFSVLFESESPSPEKLTITYTIYGE